MHRSFDFSVQPPPSKEKIKLEVTDQTHQCNEASINISEVESSCIFWAAEHTQMLYARKVAYSSSSREILSSGASRSCPMTLYFHIHLLPLFYKSMDELSQQIIKHVVVGISNLGPSWPELW